MKTIIKLTTALILLLGSMVIQAQTTEVKGVKNTYIQEEVPGLYVVYNKNNTLIDITPSYLLYEHTPPVVVGRKLELDGIVYSYFAPFFKRYSGVFKRSTALNVSLFSDINGVITEILIAYPIEVGIIPINVIEEFEKAVLQSSVKLVFDKNKREFEGTAWVGQYAAYNSDKLRDYKE